MQEEKIPKADLVDEHQFEGELPCKCDTLGIEGEKKGYHVYAVGRIRPQFPSPSVHNEFLQAAASLPTESTTSAEMFYEVLNKIENRYLVHNLQWALIIEGVEAYILKPRFCAEFPSLVATVRTEPRREDVDVVIGWATGEMAVNAVSGAVLPIVEYDKVYSFTEETLLKAIPKPKSVEANKFAKVSREIFGYLGQLAGNKGRSDRERALNYLAVRYPAIYALATECYARGFYLTSVDTKASALSTERIIVDVVFNFTNRTTDVKDTYFVRVDVTERFPFLLSKIQPYCRI